MSSSLQRLRNRITGNIFGTTRQSNPIEKPDLSRGAQNNSDTSHLNLDGDPYSYAVHQYPEDLGNNDFGHYILFHIFERKNSRYISPTKSKAVRTLTGDNAKREAEEGIIFSSQTANSGNIIPEDKEKFNMTADERPGYSTSYNLRDEQFIKSRDTIALYLPPNLSVSYSHDYKNDATGLAGLVAQTAGVAGEGQSLKDFLAAQGGEENTNTLISVLGEIGLTKGALQIGQFVGLGEGQAQLNKILNEAPNPALEAIFQGTGFREFEYTFRFTPRSENEVRVVDDIVRLFKFHAAPERMYGEKVGRHFRMPAEFDIFYMYQGQQNKWYPMIHSCVCNSVNVSFGPGGESQHFRLVDGSPAPIETNLTLKFTETEVMTKDMIKAGF